MAKKNSLLDCLTEFWTLDSYLGDCEAKNQKPDTRICRMLTSMTAQKLSYYEDKLKIEISEDPFYPEQCVDFVIHAQAQN